MELVHSHSYNRPYTTFQLECRTSTEEAAAAEALLKNSQEPETGTNEPASTSYLDQVMENALLHKQLI